MAIALDGELPDSSRDDGAGQFGAGQPSGGRFTSRSATYSVPPSVLTGRYIGLSAASNEMAAPEQDARPGRIAETESQASRKAPETPVTAADLNPRLVKESFARLMSAGPAVMEYCYARLFAANPEVRSLFPMSMTALRQQVFTAFARLIWSLDNEPRVSALLVELASDHRRFGVTDHHYDAFFAALRDTARHFLGRPGPRQPQTPGRPHSTSCPRPCAVPLNATPRSRHHGG